MYTQVLDVDLHKSSDRLNRAYNDSEGLTARFNLNALMHINDACGADFNTRKFSHNAFYNTEQRRIEMHLVSDAAQAVVCGGTRITLDRGESIHTESSYKYTVESFRELAESADMLLVDSWLDADALFSVHYLCGR